MVKAVDNLVTDAHCAISDLLSARQALYVTPKPCCYARTHCGDEVVAPVPKPLGEEELLEREQAGYQRGREEAVAEYEAQINKLRAELEQRNAADLPGMLGKIETEVNGSLNQRLHSLESELVEFATEAAIRLVNGLPISTKIVESSIQDALGHCEMMRRWPCI